MVSSAARVSLLLLLLTLTACSASSRTEVVKVTVHLDKGTTVHIQSSKQDNNCKVCTKKLLRRCDDAKQFKDTTVSVEFECTQHRDIFTEFAVKIEQDIECSTKSCNGHINQIDTSFDILLAFNHTFTWNLRASQQTSLRIDFGKTGLRQIHPSETCEDGHSYTLQASQATGSVAVGKYCRRGSISSVQIQNNGRFSVEVPARQKLQNDQFNVSVAEEIKSIAKITLTFPEGTSSCEMFSPNFPDSFPTSSVVEWDVRVPDQHRTSVRFLNVTQPHCRKNMTAVEYGSRGRAALVRSLTDPQHDRDMGNVSVTLRSCEMDMEQSSSGLSVKLRVSVTPSPDLTAILSLVAAVAAISVIAVLVACVVIKKKKKKSQNYQTSIYNPDSSSRVLPGLSSSPDPSEDDYHVYASIDDTKVYSQLLKDELHKV